MSANGEYDRFVAWHRELNGIVERLATVELDEGIASGEETVAEVARLVARPLQSRGRPIFVNGREYLGALPMEEPRLVTTFVRAPNQTYVMGVGSMLVVPQLVPVTEPGHSDRFRRDLPTIVRHLAHGFSRHPGLATEAERVYRLAGVDASRGSDLEGRAHQLMSTDEWSLVEVFEGLAVLADADTQGRAALGRACVHLADTIARQATSRRPVRVGGRAYRVATATGIVFPDMTGEHEHPVLTRRSWMRNVPAASAEWTEGTAPVSAMRRFARDAHQIARRCGVPLDPW